MPNDHVDLELQQAGSQQPSAAFRRSPAPRSQHREKNTDFMLTGFHQEHGIRHYVFQCSNNNGTSSEFTVEADVRMLRKYGIGLQELPLLCRHLLEKQNPGSPVRAVKFGEDLMKEQADRRAALKQAALGKKKVYRRRRPEPLGQYFR